MSRTATHTSLLLLVILGLANTTSVWAEAAATTRTRLAKYGDDMAAAWTDYPKDNQKTVRDQKLQDLNTQFNREVNALDVPSTVTVEKAIEFYIDNINKTKTIFKLDKMQAERQSYLTGCAAVLRREVQQASDYKAARTTQQCFKLMLDSLVKARDVLHALPIEIKQPAYQAINTAVIDLFRNATAPEKSDPAADMDANIKAARAKFPTTSPEMETANRPIFNMLESAAKQLEQQAMQHK